MKIIGAILIALLNLIIIGLFATFSPVAAIIAMFYIVPAIIANKKGRSFNGWWFYSVFLFFIALPHSILIKKDIESIENELLSEGMKKCPYCAELVKGEAIICKHCGKELIPSC